MIRRGALCNWLMKWPLRLHKSLPVRLKVNKLAVAKKKKTQSLSKNLLYRSTVLTVLQFENRWTNEIGIHYIHTWIVSVPLTCQALHQSIQQFDFYFILFLVVRDHIFHQFEITMTVTDLHAHETFINSNTWSYLNPNDPTVNPLSSSSAWNC